jgi:hypothetical protein
MTPLERAARAMYEHVRKEFPKATCEWEEMGERTRETYVSSVRAAILSIREPSEEVHAEGKFVMMTTPWAELTSLKVWRGMIDALLEEGK